MIKGRIHLKSLSENLWAAESIFNIKAEISKVKINQNHLPV